MWGRCNQASRVDSLGLPLFSFFLPNLPRKPHTALTHRRHFFSNWIWWFLSHFLLTPLEIPRDLFIYFKFLFVMTLANKRIHALSLQVRIFVPPGTMRASTGTVLVGTEACNSWQGHSSWGQAAESTRVHVLWFIATLFFSTSLF